MDNLQTIVPAGILEVLSFSENRKVFRNGDDELVPAGGGLMELHVRRPGEKPFTVYVTGQVFDDFVRPGFV